MSPLMMTDASPMPPRKIPLVTDASTQLVWNTSPLSQSGFTHLTVGPGLLCLHMQILEDPDLLQSSLQNQSSEWLGFPMHAR